MKAYEARRLLDDRKPDGYTESDRDFLDNNMSYAVRLLEVYPVVLAALQADDLCAEERIEAVYEAFEDTGLINYRKN